MKDELEKCRCTEMLYGNGRYMEKVYDKNLKCFKVYNMTF